MNFNGFESTFILKFIETISEPKETDINNNIINEYIILLFFSLSLIYSSIYCYEDLPMNLWA